ncbi:TonB-dependent siderophore receptor [Methylosinus sp. LW4]|uniref:TonB-dependent siderophore receptor n=1 Tax=Methylosinus sp. LW4 TaxID=136993 RepID=UPI0006ACE991|nr:TonB-dependent receptor [Methylosinus sp. LW4]
MSALAAGAGPAVSPAKASISAQQRSGWVQSYEIPSGPMAPALNTFAYLNGLHLAYEARVTERLRTRGLAGAFSTTDALDRLLEGTGLGYRFSDNGRSVSIVLAQNDVVRNDAGGAEALPPIDVGAESRGVPGGASGAAQQKAYRLPNASSATKTDTPIMETPASVHVVPQAVLQDQQVTRIEKALQNVSGVIQMPYNQGGTDSFLIRGFANSTIYRDGFLMPDAIGGGTSKRDTANLERVEVLKGPGSILYGRSEPGGIVNLITKQPLDERRYAIQQQIGSFGLYRTTLDATGPIDSEKSVLYRINVAYENAGSFRDFMHNDRILVAPVVRWNIDSHTQATVEFEYEHFNDPVDPGIPPLGSRPAPIPRNRYVSEPKLSNSTGDRYLFGFNWSRDLDKNWTLRHRFVGELWRFGAGGSLFFGSANADGSLDRFENISYAGNRSDRYFTNVNLVGKVETFGIKHNLLFGYDYFHIDDSVRFNCCAAAPAFNIFAPAYLSFATPRDHALDGRVSYTQSWSGYYFQDQIELPYDIFLLAGLRYDDASGQDNVAKLVTTKDNRVSPRAGALWRPVPWLSVYGSYTENFGVSNSIYRSMTSNMAPAQTARQWEGGVKTEFFDGKLSATASFFDLTKNNIGVPDPVNPMFTRTIGQAGSRGVEFDLSGEVLPGLRIIAAYTHIGYAKTIRDVGWDGGLGYTGKRLFLVPRNSGSLWSTYEFDNGGLSGLKVGAGVVASDDRYGDAGNTFVLPSYAVFNLMASYNFTFQGKKLTAQINVDNLFDRTYWIGTNSATFITPGAPRTVLGSLKVEF